jgi:hypothetical protein
VILALANHCMRPIGVRCMTQVGGSEVRLIFSDCALQSSDGLAIAASNLLTWRVGLGDNGHECKEERCSELHGEFNDMGVCTVLLGWGMWGRWCQAPGLER